MAKVVGIDLGTTFSAVAHVNQHGKAEIIQNRDGEWITPSVVLFDGGLKIVGTQAKNQSVISPDNVAQFIKRQMGDPDYIFVTDSGDEFRPEEISALILKRLKEDAESVLGEAVNYAVITVPAYFNDAQRKATQDAGEIAGFQVLRIINEPTAAALAYGLDKQNKEETVLVYDLGGGTFDVTAMRISPGKLDVISTHGDRNLGGFDWDNRICEYVADEIKYQGGPDIFDDLMLTQELREKSEKAKIQLSSRDKAKIIMSAEGKHYSIELTLDKFQELTEDLIDRTAEIAGDAMSSAALQWCDIDKILLVGGSTRMKAVPSLIERISGKKPSSELHPDQVVAIGAALQATMLDIPSSSGSIVPEGRQHLTSVQISDVCSHSLGVLVKNDANRLENSIIIKRDTALPCVCSEDYCTVSDNQSEIELKVTQGEHLDPDCVTIIGTVTLKIPPYPKGASIRVNLAYDVDGLIRVTVDDLSMGKSLGEFTIDRRANLADDEIAAMKNKIASLLVD